MSLKHRFFLRTAVLAALCSCANVGDPGSDKTVRDETVRATRMQEFVEAISAYGRGKRKGFIVVPQNGSELAFNNAAPEDGLRDSYINAIDGIGIEELFYDRVLKPDNERIAMLRNIKAARPPLAIMVSDIVNDDEKIPDAVQLCKAEEFLAFPRSSDNEDYKLIPNVSNGNKNDVTALAAAENYLYLISDTAYNDKTSMLAAVNNTNYDLVLMDLFFQDKNNPFTAAEINDLKQKSGGGTRLVLAYVSIGSAEKYRYYWKPEWKKGNPAWIKKNYSGYPDEYWVEYWNGEWKKIIFEYLDKIIDAGFDGVYLDNVEAYYFIGR